MTKWASATLCFLTLTCSINPLTIARHSGHFPCIISLLFLLARKLSAVYHGFFNFKITLCLGVNALFILLAVQALTAADTHCLFYQTCIFENLCQRVHANYQLIATLIRLIIADSLFSVCMFAWNCCLFWSISIGQIEFASSGRHARVSGLYMSSSTSRVLMFDQASRQDHHHQIFLVYDSFASSSLRRNSVYKKMIALVCLFVLWHLFSKHLFLPYSSPLSLFTVLWALRSPKWHWAPFTSSFTLFYWGKHFCIVCDRLSHRQSSPLHK